MGRSLTQTAGIKLAAWIGLACFLILIGVEGTAARKLTPEDLRSRFGGSPDDRCAGFKDCSIECAYNSVSMKCESCDADTGGTTQYPACFPGAKDQVCKEDTSQTANCGFKYSAPADFLETCKLDGVFYCKTGTKGAACLTYFKLEKGGSICPPGGGGLP